MMDLIEFLRARLGEMEKSAQIKTVSRRMVNGQMVDVPIRENPRAWALPPSLVLADVESKRRIIDRVTDVGWATYAVRDVILLELVQPFSGHPDLQSAMARVADLMLYSQK